MARKRKKKNREKQGGAGQGKRAIPTPRKRSGPNWPVLVLALAGVGLTSYLTLSAWFEAAPAFCGEGSPCDIVQQSRWGALLGIPTSFWGLAAYLAIAYLAFRERKAERQWKFTWMLALLGLAYSIYLTVISLVVIEATCGYCLVSLALMAALFATVALQHPKGMADFSWPSWAGQTVVLAGLMVAGLHIHYSGLLDSGAGPEDPYLKALAIHLADSGVVFYGAYW